MGDGEDAYGSEALRLLHRICASPVDATCAALVRRCAAAYGLDHSADHPPPRLQQSLVRPPAKVRACTRLVAMEGTDDMYEKGS